MEVTITQVELRKIFNELRKIFKERNRTISEIANKCLQFPFLCDTMFAEGENRFSISCFRRRVQEDPVEQS